MRVNNLIFEKHKFKVACQCGHEEEIESDSVIVECKVLKISHCNECCPDCTGIASQIPYTADMERIYV